MGPASSAQLRTDRRTRPAETFSAGSVQVWGENVYCQAAGIAEENPTILFLHEAGGSLATWDGQVVGLAQKARGHALDLPGHGRSEGLGFTSIQEYRHSVVAFLDALAIRWPAVLVGVCLGAAVAVDLALHEPDRVAGLVLAGVSEGGRACDTIWRQTSVGEAPEAFVERLFSPFVSPRIRSARLQQWRLTSPTVRHGDLVAVRNYPFRQSLQQVDRPVMLVAGELDPIATPETTRKMVQGLRHASVAEMPRAGCLSMMEQPGLFNHAVTGFVERLSPALPAAELRRAGGYRRR